MSLTKEEIAFYNSFKEILKREGIDAAHPYRLSEVVAVEDYIDDDGVLQKNIPEPAMFERNNDPHIGRFNTEFMGNYRYRNAYMVFSRPNNANDLSEIDRKNAFEDIEYMKKWMADNLKNPFDSAQEPSENLIKNLYRAYKENRLGIVNDLYININKSETPNNMCYIYEAKDGSMKLSSPSSEIDDRYPFTLCTLGDKVDFYLNIHRSPECRDFLTKKFGEGVVESIEPCCVNERDIPRRPGFFTRVRASLFKHQASVEKVEAYDRYNAAVGRFNKIYDAIAKDAFPDAKNPSEMLWRYFLNIGPECAGRPVDRQKILSTNNNIKSREEVQNRLEQLTKDRSEAEKDLVKFALESQYDARLPKVVRDFLKDVPDVYKELVNFDDMDLYANGDNKQLFLKSPEAEKNQKMLAKFAVFKMVADDLKEGKLGSDTIQAIKNGEGEKLVEALRVSSTFQQGLTNEVELRNILTATAAQTNEHFSVFQKYFKMSMGDLYSANLADANKRVEDVRKEKADDSQKAAQAAKVAAEAKAAQAAKDARYELCSGIMNSAKTSLTDEDLAQLTEAYKADYKEKPTVENFSRWKVMTSATRHQAENKAMGKGNITKNSIKRSISECEEMIEQLGEFKKQLETGKFNTPELADFEFALAKGDSKENAVKQGAVENKNKPEVVDNKKVQEPVAVKADEPVVMK